MASLSSLCCVSHCHQAVRYGTANPYLWNKYLLYCKNKSLHLTHNPPPPHMPQLAAHIRSESISRILNVTSLKVNNNIWMVTECMCDFTTGNQLRKVCLLVKSDLSCCRCRHPSDIKVCREQNCRSHHMRSVISPCFHIYSSQRHTTRFIFPSRFPPASDSQRRVHAFAFMDTLQQSWAPPREEAPQWFGHPRPNEAGEAQVGVTFRVKEGERERPEAARAGGHWPERPPACHCALQNPLRCSANKFSVTCSVLMVSRCAIPQTFLLLSLCSPLFYTQATHLFTQRRPNPAPILAASQGGGIAF